MIEVRLLRDPRDLASLPPGPTAPLDAAAWAASAPDAHLALLDGGGLAARASVWWTGGPAWPDAPGVRVGRIGHLVCPEHGPALIAEALDVLRVHGCGAALGPMDGSSWGAYRVVTDAAPQGGPPEPAFALEPFPPPAAGEALRAAGFGPVATYHSARVPALDDASEDWDAARARLDAYNMSLRTLDPARATADLRAIYGLSVEAFAGNAFYSPVPEAAFLAAYEALLARADPRLILLAERDKQLVGVGFALPDLAQVARSEPVDTVVVKTIAVSAAARGAGLGGALTLGLHEAARTMGLTRAIHALMHDANPSVRISRHTATPMRRYALLGRPL
jgi:L-amino acid N-acyltransferase YncA